MLINWKTFCKLRKRCCNTINWIFNSSFYMLYIWYADFKFRGNIDTKCTLFMFKSFFSEEIISTATGRITLQDKHFINHIFIFIVVCPFYLITKCIVYLLSMFSVCRLATAFAETNGNPVSINNILLLYDHKNNKRRCCHVHQIRIWSDEKNIFL